MERFGALARRARRATLLAVAAACSDPRSTTVTTPEPATRPEAAAQRRPPVQYRVAPPAGKLPWPQHDPAFSPEQYEAMLRDLYIANNFALLQAGPEPSSSYLHHGIDVVLDNGTPIHAVQSGYVRSIMDSPQAEFYKWILIEDADAPGEGWGYAHVDDFRVKVGDHVPQGTRIASVRFRGLEHVHVDRIRRPEGGDWRDLYSLVNEQPESYFVYDDTQPPVFFERTFYFRNQSDGVFAPPASGGRVTVSGDVDVVVGVRDPGEHGHSRRFPVDDRQAPARLEYAIAPLGGTAPRRASFDFRTLRIPRLRNEAPVVTTVFKFHRTVIPTNVPSAFESRMAFYVVTNVPEGGRAGMVDPTDAALSWRTAERRADGTPRYPDGEYVVTVWAYDFRGNVASRSDTVRVRN
jgi:hypothetical protein